MEFSSFCHKNYKKLKSDLMEKIEFDFYDDHWGNMGIKDGKLVCIDFE